MVLGVVRADGESGLLGGIGERMALLDVLLDGRLDLAQRLERGADADFVAVASVSLPPRPASPLSPRAPLSQ